MIWDWNHHASLCWISQGGLDCYRCLLFREERHQVLCGLKSEQFFFRNTHPSSFAPRMIGIAILSGSWSHASSGKRVMETCTQSQLTCIKDLCALTSFCPNAQVYLCLCLRLLQKTNWYTVWKKKSHFLSPHGTAPEAFVVLCLHLPLYFTLPSLIVLPTKQSMVPHCLPTSLLLPYILVHFFPFCF